MVSQNKRCVIIYNPQAGQLRGGGADRLQCARIILTQAGFATTIRPTSGPGSAAELARILVSGRGAPVNLAEAAKWHLVSHAGGETDLELDDVVNKLDPQTRAAAEKAAKPWLDEIAAARQAQAAAPAQPPQAAPAKR